MQNMFKVNNRSTRYGFGVFMVTFDYIWHIVLLFFVVVVVFLFWGGGGGGELANFEHVNAGWNTLFP